MDAKKKKNLEETYERILNVGFCLVPYEDLSDITGPDPMVYGTAKDERILSFEGVEALFKSQYEQVGNMKPAIDRKRIALRISNGGNNACIIEEITFTLSSEEEIHTIFMRATCVMEYLDNQWKLTHWHTSTPVDTENDPWHMEEWKREKEKLQQLVDEQTAALKQNNRELQIEAALEKIRSGSLAMQKTEDLREVVKVLFEQMQGLSVDMGFASVSIFIFEDGSRNIRQWLPLPDGVSSLSVPYFDHPISSDLFDAKESGEDFFTKVYTLEEKNTWLAHGFEHTDYKDLPVDFKSSLLQAPGYAMAITLAKNSGICIPSFEGKLPTPEDIQIMKRVGKVFEQAYIRFLDLQKAEAQAKEAQVEAALERVRSRSMAMHRSAELRAVVDSLYGELKSLQINFDNAVIQLIKDDTKDLHLWISTADGLYNDMIHWPASDLPHFDLMYEARVAQSDVEISLSPDQINAFFGEYFGLPYVPQERKAAVAHVRFFWIFGTYQMNTCVFLMKYSPGAFSAYEKDIITRFAKVFEQTYTRFLDLQKAESQAREAKIESALERVRSRSLAMHHSSELSAVVDTLLREFTNLEFTLTFCIINLIDEKDMSNTVWAANPETGKDPESYYMKFEDYLFHHAMWDAWKAQEKRFVYTIEGEEKKIYDQYLYNETEFRRFPKHIQEANKALERYVAGFTFFKYSGLQTVSVNPISEDELEILERFGRVFEQAYTRFLDLQKAEAQAREAQIQLSLERVRARSMAMQSSEELHDVLSVLFRQFDSLGIQPVNVFLSLFDREKRTLTYRASGKSGTRIPGKQVVEVDSMEPLRALYDKWIIDNSDSVEVIYYPKEVIPQLFGIFADTFATMPEEDRMGPADFPEGGYSMAGYTPFGYLGYDHQRQATAEEKDILSRFCLEFTRVYQRFLDIQKAEAQAREARIESALEKVRAQTMGMQSSKDLSEVASVMFNQMKNLGGELFSFAIVLCDKHKNMVEQWHNIGNEGMMSPFFVPIDLDYIHQYRYDQWMSGAELFSIEIPKDYIVRHFELMFDLPSVQAAMAEAASEGIKVEIPEWEIDYGASFRHGYLLISSFQPYKEDHIFPRFAKVFDQAYTRFLDLQKAEAQTREAQIQLALERVRAKTMAMKTQHDLLDVIEIFGIQLVSLGIRVDFSSFINGDITKNRDWDLWIYSPSVEYPPQRILIPFTETAYFTKTAKNIEEYERTGNPIQVKSFTKKEKDDFLDHYNRFAPLTSNEIKEFVYSTPGSMIVDAFLGEVTVSIVKYELEPYSEDQLDIFRRFSNEFKQTYTRFLDLQRAEAQAREAKIEAALEQVRSRSLAVNKVDEFNEVVRVVFEKLSELDIPANTVTIMVNKGDTQDFDVFGSAVGETGLMTVKFGLPYFKTPMMDDIRQVRSSSEEGYYSKVYSQEEKNHYYEFAFKNTELKNLPDDLKLQVWQNKAYAISAAYAKNSILGVNDFEGNVLGADQADIIRRFSKVFEQAYIRFLDLQRAEAQAREAQIEAALERIRSRAMAMQHSEELRDVALELRTQMGILGQKDLEVCAIHLYEEHKDHFESWAAMHSPGKEERLIQFQALFPKSGKLIIDEMMDCYASDQNEYVLVNEGEKGKQWFELLKEKAPEAFQYLMEATANIPAEEMKAYWGIADFSGGALVMVTYFYPDKDSRDLLRRTANVFALAYKRFKDLRMAESSARASMRQASLDRIRADISSMRNAEDLKRITPLVFNELTALGIPFIRCGVFIVHEKNKNVEVYLSTPEGKSLAVMTLPFNANEMTARSVEAWKKEEVYVQHWDQSDFVNWSKSLQEQGHVKDLKTYQDKEAAPESLHLHFIPFSQGLLYVGSTEKLGEEQIELVKALAKSFAIAYARFEDFVKLEQAKAEVESAMSELKATQSQLVQQEKLASLGQLTAGIAHEIKNPLNFVNNFSEVSIELIEEAQEEIVKTQHAASPIDQNNGLDEIIAILDDVQSNLTKIHEHGTRANNIVTSMLQHSRGGSGKKEPTDLNALIKEYVNLSYHGMRAGNNPIDVTINLDLDPDIREVSLIKEDFSRVVINLCNNAFDAMKFAVKPQNIAAQRAASLRVRTKKSGDAITIEIADNGPGIPDAIKDKILQPFFTTKKGTEGTGLGLSITHDIVKAHGGEIKVVSRENEGSMFTIQFPIS